jgi:hypothetical protein
MSDPNGTPPTAAPKPADAAEAPSREDPLTADQLAGRIAREVTLTWRAIEEVDVRLGVIEAELVVGLALVLLVAVLLKGRKP